MMKKMFEWMREQMEEISYEEDDYFSNSFLVIDSEDAIEKINEAEAKFEGQFVSIETYKQVAWERDTAIEQLHELGYELGEKPREAEQICQYIKRKDYPFGFYTSCGGFVKKIKISHEYCPYCGKPIKISEVE